ncbi:MAG: cytochrome C [Cyclobacteriaceae bacterium]|nr:cytochrome C [Cyclobacteriaceae bacterium]
MSDEKILSIVKKIYRFTLSVFIIIFTLFLSTIYYYNDPTLSLLIPKEEKNITSSKSVQQKNAGIIQDGIHLETGLIEGEGLMLVVQNCTSCHSAKMITQNRANKEGWRSMIKWMQQTQNLWDLGENEEKIIDYLSTNYPPQKKGRRATLTNIEWYNLD